MVALPLLDHQRLLEAIFAQPTVLALGDLGETLALDACVRFFLIEQRQDGARTGGADTL